MRKRKKRKKVKKAIMFYMNNCKKEQFCFKNTRFFGEKKSTRELGLLDFPGIFDFAEGWLHFIAFQEGFSSELSIFLLFSSEVSLCT